jgi:hypothetical protein
MSGVVVTPSFNAAYQRTNGQTLVFNEVPSRDLTIYDFVEPPRTSLSRRRSSRPQHGELYGVLMNFRGALLAGAAHYPCFKPSKDREDKENHNTIQLAFTAITTVGGNVAIKVGPVASFGFGDTVKTTLGNTLSVTFKVLTPTGNNFFNPV